MTEPTDGDLKLTVHAYRAGLWVYDTALRNMTKRETPEIEFDRKSKLWRIVAKNVAN